ncbi:unnamed protein product [Rotaria sordida]|uniref:Piezo TM25-28 domain-containing protein n=2 Tax=Rotaria sordida TaxID=392033 RepID=A0A819JL86_9BILA|nr:unnamed protein product [Rotaria sordida]
MYAKAKDTNVLIRLPCNLVETVADKSIKIAFTVANPLVKPLYGLEVMNTFNEKTESIRHVMNSVKDTTTSTIQRDKETVFHVATITVHKTSDVAGSVFSFGETHVPGIQHLNASKTIEFHEHACSTVSSLYSYVFHSVQSSLIWDGLCMIFLLLQKRIFASYYWQHIVTELHSQAKFASQGGILFNEMLRKRREEDDKREEQTIFRVLAARDKDAAVAVAIQKHPISPVIESNSQKFTAAPSVSSPSLPATTTTMPLLPVPKEITSVEPKESKKKEKLISIKMRLIGEIIINYFIDLFSQYSHDYREVSRKLANMKFEHKVIQQEYIRLKTSDDKIN